MDETHETHETGETAGPHPETGPGSYVSADAGIELPGERTHATPGDTYEGIRDNEQLGRTRNKLFQEVQEISPPASEEARIQNDQIGRQRVQSIYEEMQAAQAADYQADAANTDGTDAVELGRLERPWGRGRKT